VIETGNDEINSKLNYPIIWFMPLSFDIRNVCRMGPAPIGKTRLLSMRYPVLFQWILFNCLRHYDVLKAYWLPHCVWYSAVANKLKSSH
jgi:hypothetical protein